MIEALIRQEKKTVSNPNLLYFNNGIDICDVTNTDINTVDPYIKLTFINDTNIYLTGDPSISYFTDSSFIENYGQKYLCEKDKSCSIYISKTAEGKFIFNRKYLKEIDSYAAFIYYPIDISFLSNLKNIERIYLSGDLIKGNINSLEKLEKLSFVCFGRGSTNIYGNADFLFNKPNITYIEFFNCYSIEGNLDNIPDSFFQKRFDFLEISSTKITGSLNRFFENIETIKIIGIIFNSYVSGDLNLLKNKSTSRLTKLYSFANKNENITGDIASLSGFYNLTHLVLPCPNITGDITEIINNCTKLTELSIPQSINITDDQKEILIEVVL